MKLTMEQVLNRARPVLPVLVIEDVSLALDLAGALHAGGIDDQFAVLVTQYPALIISASGALFKACLCNRAIHNRLLIGLPHHVAHRRQREQIKRGHHRDWITW